MTQTSAGRYSADATRDLPAMRVGEVVLQTSRFEEMKAWWDTVLGTSAFFENERFSFRYANADERQTLAIFNKPDLAQRPATMTGLEHVQFRHNTLSELLDRYERLKAVGIVPQQTMNHGPATGFYYRDPDNNRVELAAPNFATEEEHLAYIASPAFARNPSGITIDPDDFLARCRAGVPQTEIVRIADD
jgi:catechol-2,3-dioxygenase